MNVRLLLAQEVEEGDYIEIQHDMTWHRINRLENQFGKVYFITGVTCRSASVDDFVLVGRRVEN